MKQEYDFSNGQKNPYTKKLTEQITIKLDTETIDYFKRISEGANISYQVLISLYLADCAQKHKKISVNGDE